MWTAQACLRFPFHKLACGDENRAASCKLPGRKAVASYRSPHRRITYRRITQRRGAEAAEKRNRFILTSCLRASAPLRCQFFAIAGFSPVRTGSGMVQCCRICPEKPLTNPPPPYILTTTHLSSKGRSRFRGCAEVRSTTLPAVLKLEPQSNKGISP